VIIKPYFINSLKEKLTFLFLRIEIHIIPARAPRGEIFAPRLEPITVANIAGRDNELADTCIIGTYATVIGILLRMFAKKAEEKPKRKTLDTID